jgi:hypothetical protein
LANEITIAWNPSPGAISGYNVFRGTSSGNESAVPLNGTTLIPPTATPSFVDNTVASGVTYYYEVTAVFNGVSSLDSVQVISAPVPYPPAPATIDMGTASSFGILAGSAITNTGATDVIGDVGISPGTSITGFGAPASITGVFHIGDFVAAAAQQSLTTAYNTAVSALNPVGLNPPPVVTNYALTSAAATGLYTGTFPSTSLNGLSVTISGFTNAVNNGTFLISASTITTISVSNSASVAETATANAAVSSASGGTAAIVLSGDIGGQTLTPGVYKSASSVGITGTLTLDAQGNAGAVWIFQIGSTLTTASGNSDVVLINGGTASNVFWAVGSSATLNAGTSFSGNVMAMASISVGSGTSVNGRLLASTGAVTLIDDSISLSIPGTLVLNARNTVFTVGDIFFDCGTNTFQEAITSGMTCGSLPVYNATPGGTTVDCGVTWLTLDPPTGTLLPLPPSPPNVPPAPPAAPLNPRITSET